MRWRIAGAYIILIVLTLALLSLALLQLLRRTYLQTLESGLAGQARLVATITETQAAAAPSAQHDALARDLSDQLHGRVTLIAADGTVLADSLLPPAARENLSDRPEVRDALALGSGASERNSAATGDEMFYVAVPFGPVNAPTGIARVGVPLTTIAEAQARLTLTVLVAAASAAVVGLGLAVWIAGRTTRPLLELRAMAARLAGGDLAVQVPIPPDEEVAALAQDFNVMASRLRQLLATIETERQRLATVLATMADGILMVGPHETVTFANRAAEGMIAVAADQLPRALTALPVGPTLLPVLRDIRAGRAHGTPIVVEEAMAPTTGRSLRAVVTPLPTAEDDQALIVLQDLTELRRVEHARRRFLANISHDLRTPLASLQAMIETLQDGALDDREAARDFLARMDDEVQSLNRLVTDFLELSRIESGQLELHLAPTNLRALLRGATARMTAQAEQRGVALTLAAPNIRELITATPTAMPQEAQTAQERRDLNEVVHGVLILGLLISTALMIAGVGLDLFAQRELPTSVPDIGNVINRVLVLRPSGFLALGLLVLIATPILRVIGSIGAFLYARDWRFASLTTLVLIVLLVSLMLGRG